MQKIQMKTKMLVVFIMMLLAMLIGEIESNTAQAYVGQNGALKTDDSVNDVFQCPTHGSRTGIWCEYLASSSSTHRLYCPVYGCTYYSQDQNCWNYYASGWCVCGRNMGGKITGSITAPSIPITTSNSKITLTLTITNGADYLVTMKYPTWSAATDSTGDAQDDLVWYSQSGNGTTTYTYTVDLKNHSPGTAGKYYINCYAYDRSGKSFYVGGTSINYVSDAVPPTFSDFTVSKEYTNNNQESLLVSVIVTDDVAVGTVNIHAWYGEFSTYFTQKDASYNSSTGKYEAYFTLAEIVNSATNVANQPEGIFSFDGRAYDTANNNIWIGMAEVLYDTTAPEIELIDTNKKFTNNEEETILAYAKVLDSDVTQVMIVSYYGESGTSYTQTEATYNESSGYYEISIKLSEIKSGSTGNTNNGEGLYYFECTATDKAGNAGWKGTANVMCDTTPPTITASSVTYPSNVTMNLQDTLSGIIGWGVTRTNSSPSSSSSDSISGSLLNTWYGLQNTTSETTTTFTGLDAGTYYGWAKDLAGNTANVSFTVNKVTVTKPTLDTSKTYTYNGSVQTATLKNFDSATMNISKNTRTDAGTQRIIVELKNKNLKWADGTTDNLFIEWKINPKTISIDWANTELIYNGTYQKPAATVSTGVNGESIVVTVSGEGKNVGDYTATAQIESVSGGQGRISNYTLGN